MLGRRLFSPAVTPRTQRTYVCCGVTKRDRELAERRSYIAPCWYVIALSENIRPGKPHGVSCFDRDMVLYRDRHNGGRIIAQDNVCPHRGAPLDRGWLEEEDRGASGIACPYHGWVFDPDGRIASVPSMRVSPRTTEECVCQTTEEHISYNPVARGGTRCNLPQRRVLPTYTEDVCEHGGYVWYLYRNGVNRGELLQPPPIPTARLERDIEEERTLGVKWRPVYGEIAFDAPHWNVFDNAIDITHIHYLHGDSFGNASKPEIKDFQLLSARDEPHHAHMRFRIHNKPANFLWHWTVVDDVEVDMQIWLPFTSIIKITLGAGVQMITVVNTTPISADRSINRFCLWRNFAPWGFLDRFARDAMMTILGQDKAMVELLKPEQSVQEISLRPDMTQIVFRKLYQKFVRRHM